jgi:hypothetical protein
MAVLTREASRTRKLLEGAFAHKLEARRYSGLWSRENSRRVCHGDFLSLQDSTTLKAQCRSHKK